MFMNCAPCCKVNKLEKVALCICEHPVFFENPKSARIVLLNFQGLPKFRYSGPNAPGAKIK